MRHLSIKYICVNESCSENKEAVDFGCDEVEGVFALPGAIICAGCTLDMMPLSREVQ